MHWLAERPINSSMGEVGSETVDELLDWHEITRRSFDDNWVNLSALWKNRLMSATRIRVSNEIRDWYGQSGLNAHPNDARTENEIQTGDKAQLTLKILQDNEFQSCTLRLIQGDTGWKIYDVRTAEWRLIRDRLRRFDDMISSGYNPEYVEAMMLGQESCLIDDFGAQNAGDFPKAWGWKKQDDDRMRADRIYQIGGDAANTYLRASARNVSISLVKPFSYNLKDFPLLTWRWRANALPKNSDDYAASVTVIFYQNWIGVPLAITYLWSVASSSCSIIKKEGWLYDTHAVVLRNELDPSNEWLDESVNPAEDFERIFGSPPPDQTVGLYILTTSGSSQMIQADYDDLKATRARIPTSCGRAN